MSAAKAKSLQDRIKETVGGAAPSLVPQPRVEIPAPPPKEVEYIPDLKEVVSNAKERLALARTIAQVGELGQQIKDLENQRKPLQAKIKQVAGTLGIAKAIAGAWRIAYYLSPRSSINGDKLTAALLKRGMLPKVIENVLAEATTTTNSYTLRVMAVGEEDE